MLILGSFLVVAYDDFVTWGVKIIADFVVMGFWGKQHFKIEKTIMVKDFFEWI